MSHLKPPLSPLQYQKSSPLSPSFRGLIFTFILVCCLLISPISVLSMHVEDHNLQRGVAIKSHTFQPPYLFGLSSSIPHFEYGGSAVATENFVRLVPAVKSRVGWIWSNEPLNRRNWQSIVEFQIHNTQSPGADGLAFWYTKTPKKVGSLYGYVEDFSGLGIIFDTYDNNGDGDSPSVIAVMNQGQKVQWDYANDLKANKLASCQSNFRNPINSLVRAKITYEHGILSVAMDTLGNGEFAPCFSVSVSLPQGYYLGLTAATGGLADYHDVYSLVTSDLDSNGEQENQHLEHGKKGRYNPYEFYQEGEIPREGALHEEDEMAFNREMEELSRQERQKRNQREEQINRYSNQQDNNRNAPPTPSSSSQDDRKKLRDEEKFFKNLRRKLKNVGLGDLELKNDPTGKKKPKKSLTLLKDISKLGETILEGVEEVGKVVQESSTREDVRQLIRRISSIAAKQEQVQTHIEDLHDHMKAEMSSVVGRLEHETANLDREIKQLHRLLQGYGGSLNQIQEQTGNFHKTLEQTSADVQYTIQKSSGTSIWMWILIVLSLGGCVFLYRKYTQIKYTKLF